MPLAHTGLTVSEWAMLEHLHKCHDWVDEIEGIDRDRFERHLAELEDQVHALPTIRAKRREQTEERG